MTSIFLGRFSQMMFVFPMETEGGQGSLLMSATEVRMNIEPLQARSAVKEYNIASSVIPHCNVREVSYKKPRERT